MSRAGFAFDLNQAPTMRTRANAAPAQLWDRDIRRLMPALRLRKGHRVGSRQDSGRGLRYCNADAGQMTQWVKSGAQSEHNESAFGGIATKSLWRGVLSLAPQADSSSQTGASN